MYHLSPLQICFCEMLCTSCRPLNPHRGSDLSGPPKTGPSSPHYCDYCPPKKKTKPYRSCTELHLFIIFFSALIFFAVLLPPMHIRDPAANGVSSWLGRCQPGGGGGERGKEAEKGKKKKGEA